MGRTEKAQELILETKGALITELTDLMTAATVIAKEMGVIRMDVDSDGNIRVCFYNDRFPFDAEVSKRRTLDLGDRKVDELYVSVDNIEFSVFAPKEA